ncbi:MAG: PQQ-dependent sugar dehydrogenase [Chloroflexi bacterium]|nr:PQQ-dependent sugar dehydrogenase [Chloroflexota bacterium]
MKRVIVLALAVALGVGAFGLYTAFQADDDNEKNVLAAQPAQYELVEITSGLSRPVYLTHAGDGSGRLFIVEQSGTIWTMQDGTLLDTPFLDVSGLISPEALTDRYTERGLLGLAFHPDFASNGQFFINYTDQSGHSVLARYTVSGSDPNQADLASAEQLLYVQQPFSNHNGGHLAFGPDGYLYLALGDGGSAGDPRQNGQNPTTLLGTILRLDVSTESGYLVPADNPFASGDQARPEIWAWGLRNAWRFSFDRDTGDLYIADVGQNQWEEISVQPAGSAGGENYGWNAYEGTHVYSGATPASDVVMPVLEYDHSSGRCSVTGGYVYRGTAIPGLQGYYVYGDWCSGTIWTARQTEDGTWEASVSLESGYNINSFGEDENGELYLLDNSGAVLRFDPAG